MSASPLGSGAAMLEPKMEARLLQELGLKSTDRVLEIGAGSGYMAALLAARAEFVTSLEIEPALVAMARAPTSPAPVSPTSRSSRRMASRAGPPRRPMTRSCCPGRCRSCPMSCCNSSGRWPPGCHRRHAAGDVGPAGDAHRRNDLQYHQPVRNGGPALRNAAAGEQFTF